MHEPNLPIYGIEKLLKSLKIRFEYHKFFMISRVHIDSRNQTFSGDKFRIDLMPYIVDHRNCKIGKFSIQILLKFSDQSDVSLRIII
jgi:hypothetical protein